MKALFIFGWMLLCSFSSAQVKIGGDPKIIHPHSLLELKSNTKALVLTVVTDLEIKTRATSIDTETAIGTSFQSRLKTLPFKVSDFSKWVLCDCRVKDPEYKALGNFLLTLNEDQINNSINLSQYPRSRLVNFQLYDRYGVMLFKLKSMDPKSLKDRIKNNTSYTGTYFYIVHLKAPKQIEQGYIYLIKK